MLSMSRSSRMGLESLCDLVGKKRDRVRISMRMLETVLWTRHSSKSNKPGSCDGGDILWRQCCGLCTSTGTSGRY
jgi:hypothetical protein